MDTTLSAEFSRLMRSFWFIFSALLTTSSQTRSGRDSYEQLDGVDRWLHPERGDDLAEDRFGRVRAAEVDADTTRCCLQNGGNVEETVANS